MLLRTSEERQTRILTRVGLAVLSVLALAAGLAVRLPLGGTDAQHTLSIDTDYVGNGVTDGTPVLMHGIRIGQVAAVTGRPGGGARLNLTLDPAAAAGLSTDLAMDYRPANYFGITGVHLSAGPAGGPALPDGARLTLDPRGNFTMPEFLSRLGALTDGVITPELVSVIDRATRYVDGLTPLLETVLLVTGAVAAVQTAPTGDLLRNAAGIAVAAPSFVDAVTNVAGRLDGARLADLDEQFFTDRFLATIQLASTGLFGTVGTLLSSNTRNLLPATEVVQSLARPVPNIAATEQISESLVELRTRFERMYEGSGDQRALRVRVTLDQLPGLAAGLQAMGATP